MGVSTHRAGCRRTLPLIIHTTAAPSDPDEQSPAVQVQIGQMAHAGGDCVRSFFFSATSRRWDARSAPIRTAKMTNFV